MERIRIGNLQAGKVYEEPMFSVTGQKLLNAGVTLSAQHIEVMRRHGELEVIVAKDVDELVAGGIVDQCDSSKLKVGQQAKTGLLTKTGQVLVEAGEQIESHHIDAVEAGGGAFASKAQAQQQRRERILIGDALVSELDDRISEIPLRVIAEAQTSWIKPVDPKDWPAPAKLGELRSEAVETLRRLYARIEAGVAVPLDAFSPVIADLIDRLSKYPSRFTQLALLCPRREDYLPDHAYTVTVLAMAIAAQLRWPLDAVREIAQAGMIYDLGMLLVPERIRTGACELSDIDRSRVQRHTVFSLSMIQAVENVPPVLQLASLQHHERENGSGYPRGSRRENTCDYARVLAVADSFAATTEPRHYRKPKLPYIAMEETLRSTTAMAFWKPAVRALIQAAGLFPVGSYVKLSNTKNAHVIASNPTHLDRPTVQVLTVDGLPDGNPVDLASMPVEELNVVRPVATATG